MPRPSQPRRRLVALGYVAVPTAPQGLATYVDGHLQVGAGAGVFFFFSQGVTVYQFYSKNKRQYSLGQSGSKKKSLNRRDGSFENFLF